MSFDESEILNLSPLGIVISDPNQRIVWCNARFISETQLSEKQIVGQLYPALPIEAVDKEAQLVQLFNELDKQEIKFHYWQAKSDVQPNHTIHYFAKDRTSNSKIAVSTAKISATQIPKRASWVEFLDYEVSRSRRYDNPLSILKLHLLVFDKPANVNIETLHQTIKDTLTNELRWADMIGHTENSTYLMVLPETPASALKILQEKLDNALKKQIEFIDQSIDYQLVFGGTHWQKHDDSQKMLKKARTNLVDGLEALLKSKQ